MLEFLFGSSSWSVIFSVVGHWYLLGFALFLIVGVISWILEDEVVTAKDLLMMLMVAGLGPLILVAPLIDKLAEKSDFTVVVQRSKLRKAIRTRLLRLRIHLSKLAPRGGQKTMLYNETHGRWRILWNDGSMTQLLCWDMAKKQFATSANAKLMFYTDFTLVNGERRETRYGQNAKPLRWPKRPDS